MLKPATFADIVEVAQSMLPIQKKAALALCATDSILDAVKPLAHSPVIAGTIWRDSKPVVVIGAVLTHPGVASTFMYATDQWRSCVIETTRFFKKVLLPGLLNTGIHRVQSLAMAGDETTNRWKVFLGATKSVPLDGYGKNGEDFVLHSATYPVSKPVTSA